LTAILLVYLFAFALFGLYKSRKGFLVEVDELIGTFIAVTVAWGALIIVTFLRGEYEFSRGLILLAWPISFTLLALARQIILRIELLMRSRGYGARRAAIIGSDQLAELVAARIKGNPSYGINFVGFINGGHPESLGPLSELAALVARHRIELLFVADKKLDRDKLAELAAFCDEKGIALGTIPDIFQILTTSPSVEDIEGLPMVTLKQTRFTPLNRSIKRAFDITLSLLGIIIFSLPMLLIALLIKIFSPGGPVIYAQERVGHGGQIFNLLKFRTMIPDAEAKTGPVLSSGDDPRKTPLGKILRATNLDELPQLFNILKGDMSFVGPRPERPVFVNEYKKVIPKYMERHKIRPGLAGWAQLHGGYHMPAEEKIKYDLYYIENWSFLLDIKIILKYIQIAFTFQRRN
jgi:exopolysaccharide biosynthesis polyprenyl glycosylphosphotransferase